MWCVVTGILLQSFLSFFQDFVGKMSAYMFYFAFLQWPLQDSFTQDDFRESKKLDLCGIAFEIVMEV